MEPSIKTVPLDKP